jgi:hypothetical protein
MCHGRLEVDKYYLKLTLGKIYNTLHYWWTMATWNLHDILPNGKGDYDTIIAAVEHKVQTIEAARSSLC